MNTKPASHMCKHTCMRSVQSLDRLCHQEAHDRRFSRDPLPVFSTGGSFEQFLHGQGCPLVHAAFPLPAMSPTLQGALKDGLEEAVVACDMPEPCKFPSLDSCQKRFLWTPKEVDLALHPFVGLVLQVRDAEKFPQAFDFKVLHLSLSVSKQGPCFTAIEEGGGDKRFVQPEPICCHCEGNPDVDFC